MLVDPHPSLPLLLDAMFDIALRSLKDSAFAPLSRAIPLSVAPLHVTGLGFLSGLVACALAASGHASPSVAFWLLNRVLDCLDGALARTRGQQSDLGGFFDLLADFLVYSLIPISCALGRPAPEAESDLLAIALLEASLHVNNFVLFFTGAILEKEKGRGSAQTVKELTSIAMRPALVEGLESGIFFTLMLLVPERVCMLSYFMLAGVIVSTGQRVYWLALVLARQTPQPPKRD